MVNHSKLLEKMNDLKDVLEGVIEFISKEQKEKTEEVNKIVYPFSFYKEHNSNVLLKREGNYKIPIYMSSEKINSFIIDTKYYSNEYYYGPWQKCYGLTIEFPTKYEENLKFMSYSFNGPIKYDKIKDIKEAVINITIHNENHKYPLKDFVTTIENININSLYYLLKDLTINPFLEQYKKT